MHVGGTASYPALAKRLREALPASLASEVTFRPRVGGNSDHWPFHERGVPAFAIGTKGPHPNYHTHLDDSDNDPVRFWSERTSAKKRRS